MKLVATIDGDVTGVGNSLADIVHALIQADPDLDKPDGAFLHNLSSMSENEIQNSLEDRTFLVCDCDNSIKGLFDKGNLDSLVDRNDIILNPDGNLSVGTDDDVDPHMFGEFPLSGRVGLFSRCWEVLRPGGDTMDATLEHINRINRNMGTEPEDTATLMNDIMTTMYMRQVDPVWNIHSIRPEAALLIDKSRMDYADIEWKPLMLIAQTGCALTGLVNEICIVRDGEQWRIGYTIRIAKNLAISASFTRRSPADDDSFPDPHAKNAVSFANKFLALQTCEKSPIVVRSQAQRQAVRKGLRIAGGIIRSQVSLSKRYRSAATGHSGTPIDKDGKTLAMVDVSGFVREQPYGPGRLLRKTIWIDGFTRGQWVRKGTHIVTIKE